MYIFCKVTGETAPPPLVLPPPPPLPVDRTQILRVPTNEGIGSMGAYLEMQKRKKNMEEQQKHVNDVGNYEVHDSSHIPAGGSVFEKGLFPYICIGI